MAEKQEVKEVNDEVIVNEQKEQGKESPQQQEEKSVLESTKELLELIKAERVEVEKKTQEMKAERLKFEKAAAETLVSGRSMAGKILDENKEEMAKREALKMIEGSGLNPFS